MRHLRKRKHAQAKETLERCADRKLAGIAGGGRDPQGQHLPPRLSANMAGGAGLAGLPGADGLGEAGARRDA